MAIPVTPNRHFGLWLGILLVAVCLYRIGFVLAHDYSLFVDEAQYWLWSKTPDWGYYSKPPLTAWLIGASTALCGDGEACIKLPALLAYPLAAAAIAWLAWRIAGARAALASAALFLSMPGQALGGWVVSPDAPLLLCWALALGLLHRALQAGARWWHWLALGAVVGLGMLAKYSMLVFVPGAAWVLLRRQGAVPVRAAGPWLALAVAALLILPNVAWNAQHDFETVRHTAGLARTGQAGWHVDLLAAFIGAQWLIFGLVAFPLLLARLWRGDPGSSPGQAVAAAGFLRPFVLPYLLGMCALALYSNANANWAVPAYVGGSVLVGTWLAQPQRSRLLWATLALNALLGLTVLHYRDVATMAGIELGQRRNLYDRVLGWRELGAAVQPYVDAHPGLPLIASDRTLLAEMARYLQPHPFRVAALDVDGAVSNHYELTTRAEGVPPRGLWIVAPEQAAKLRSRFVHARRLGMATARAPQGPLRSFEVYRVEGLRMPAVAGAGAGR